MTDYWRWGILAIAAVFMALVFMWVNMRSRNLKLLSFTIMWMFLGSAGYSFVRFAWAVTHANHS